MIGVNPYLSFSGNCREAIEFYQASLGAELVFSRTYGESPMEDMGTPGNIMHCTIRVGNSPIMMCDDPRGASATTSGSISLALGLNEPAQARLYFDALSQGGTVTMPLQKTFWAEAFGMVEDRFGIKWMINCDTPR